MMMNDSLIKCAVAVLFQHKWRVTSVYYWAPLIRVEYFSHDSLIKRRSTVKTLTYRLPTNERPHCCSCQTFFSAPLMEMLAWTELHQIKKRGKSEKQRGCHGWNQALHHGWRGSWLHATGKKSKNSCLLRRIVMLQEEKHTWMAALVFLNTWGLCAAECSPQHLYDAQPHNSENIRGLWRWKNHKTRELDLLSQRN